MSMFDTLDYPKSLDEDLFDSWLEKGKDSQLGYQYLLVIWNEWEEDFQPVYLTSRAELNGYKDTHNQEVAIAAYDLYSESRVQ